MVHESSFCVDVVDGVNNETSPYLPLTRMLGPGMWSGTTGAKLPYMHIHSHLAYAVLKDRGLVVHADIILPEKKRKTVDLTEGTNDYIDVCRALQMYQKQATRLDDEERAEFANVFKEG